MPELRRAYTIPLPLMDGERTVRYRPWFADISILVTPAEQMFLSETTALLASGEITKETAMFAEADLFTTGWHASDLPQPDPSTIHAAWAAYLDTQASHAT